MCNHWFRLWFDAHRQQAIIWTNDGLVSWCIYPPLGLNIYGESSQIRFTDIVKDKW